MQCCGLREEFFLKNQINVWTYDKSGARAYNDGGLWAEPLAADAGSEESFSGVARL